MIHNEVDIGDSDWVFLPNHEFPETNHVPEPNIHGPTQTNSESKLVFLTDYFNPESKLDNIKETDDNKEVKTEQVSFTKQVFNQSVDIMDSPKSTSEEFVPQNDAKGTFNFDEKISVLEEIQKDEEDTRREGDSGGGLSLWKWSLNGVGAICSFGFAAAATSCIVMLRSQQRNRQQRQDQNMFFQHYSDKKRMKQMVVGKTKVNEAICAVRVPTINRAHITFGGYYNVL